MHVPPKDFHRIRHYGLLANGNRTAMVAKARELLAMTPREAPAQAPRLGIAVVRRGCFRACHAASSFGSRARL
jgi:hypothetical protein